MLVLFEFLPTKLVLSWLKKNDITQGDETQLKSIEDGRINESDDLLGNGSTIFILGVAIAVLIILLALCSKCDKILYSHYTVFKFYM